MMDINYTKQIDFRYRAYSHDIVIIGKKNSGKTERTKRIIENSLSDIPYWIWDYSNKFNGYGHLIHNIDELEYGQYVVQERDKSVDRFKQFCNKLFFGAQSGIYTNTVLIIDELHQYLTKQAMLQELYHIVMSGRNFGISGMYISTRPQAIPNWILDNVTHVFAYKVLLEGSISWLNQYVGQEAWLLLSRDKRKLLFEPEYPELTEHSFIYRNQNDSRPQVVIV